MSFYVLRKKLEHAFNDKRANCTSGKQRRALEKAVYSKMSAMLESIQKIDLESLVPKSKKEPSAEDEEVKSSKGKLQKDKGKKINEDS